MSALAVFVVLIILFTILKLLNVTSPSRPPRLVSNDPKFLEVVLKHCPHLCETYTPVRLWGSSGHVQTLVHATLGRTYCTIMKARHCVARQEDGATVTWDVYEPSASSQFQDSYTIAVCPGIANSSESKYVQSLVAMACEQGYRCIVLNHLGVLPHVAVTSPRLFRYGKTDEYDLMLSKFFESHPNEKVVCVGFSMGGNIVCKYLGEQRARSHNIVGGISICQGYDAVRILNYLLGWQNLARLYLYSMTESMRSVIIRNKEALFTDDIKRKCNIDERRVLSAGTLPELDEVYTRRVFGFRSTEELYRLDSSANYLQNVEVPLVLINAKDDPIVHPDLLSIPERFVRISKTSSLYIETEHGGHLGYYEGGFMLPSSITWLDTTVVSLVTAMASRQS